MLVKKYIRLICHMVLFFSALVVAGCGQPMQTQQELEPPRHTAEEILKASVEYPVDVYDPLEPLNRRIYTFNYYFDTYFFLPVINTYGFITPDYLEDRISNFIDNVFEFSNLINNILQLKLRASGITLARFCVNTTIGIGGLWDHATRLGLPLQEEDFGQTLGYYGMGNGPYLVLPILGPSNLRDASGLAADALAFTLAGPPAWVDNDDVTLVFDVATAIDKRHRESFRYYETGSPFEYDMIRMLYVAKREMEIAK